MKDKKTIRLTSDILDGLIKEVMEEQVKHQALTPLQAKQHKANQRKELDKKRNFKKSYLPGVAELSALGRGIISEDDVEQLLSTEEVSQGRLYALAKKIEELEQRLRKKIKELQQLQQQINQNKPSFEQQLRFCSKIKDSLAGKLTSDKK